MREVIDSETGEVLQPEVEVGGGSALAQAHERAAMDIQVATAQKIGRDIAVFQADLMKWATLNPEVAAACTYAKPVGGGGEKVIGPSARFAELAIAAYRHVAVDVFIEEEAYGYVTVGAAARDLYRNVTIRKRVRRSVLKSDGKTRQAAHLVQNHINAASSIALRNAAFTLIPKALWLPAWLASRDTAAGSVKDFEARLVEALSFWAKKGISEEVLLAHLGKPSVKELDADDLLYLKQRYDDLRAGELKLADAFKPVEPERSSGEETARAAQDRIDGAPAPAPEAAAKRPRPRTTPKAARPEPTPAEPPAPAEPQGDGTPSVDI